jgi:hypothetical protein
MNIARTPVSRLRRRQIAVGQRRDADRLVRAAAGNANGDLVAHLRSIRRDPAQPGFVWRCQEGAGDPSQQEAVAGRLDAQAAHRMERAGGAGLPHRAARGVVAPRLDRLHGSELGERPLGLEHPRDHETAVGGGRGRHLAKPPRVAGIHDELVAEQRTAGIRQAAMDLLALDPQHHAATAGQPGDRGCVQDIGITRDDRRAEGGGGLSGWVASRPAGAAGRPGPGACPGARGRRRIPATAATAAGQDGRHDGAHRKTTRVLHFDLPAGTTGPFWKAPVRAGMFRGDSCRQLRPAGPWRPRDKPFLAGPGRGTLS